MAVTLQDIASMAEVAVSTVSRVINNRNDPHISKPPNAFLKTARELGYQPNFAQGPLVTGRTNTVALWTSGVYPSFYSYTIHCLRQVVKSSKYELQVIEMEKHYSADEALPAISFWRPDGVVVFDDPWYVKEYSKAGRALDFPVVSMGVYIIQDDDYVGVDVYSGVIEAIEHLYNTGRRRIAYFVAADVITDEITLNDQRHNAYRYMMEKAGLQPEYITYPKESPIYQRSNAREHIHRYLENNKCPEAIFCFNDEVAIGAYRGLRDMGVRIPDDVAIVGCDGIEDTEYMDVPIGTITQPYHEMCEVAWDFLQNRMDNNSIPQQKAMLKAEFVIRESCGNVGGDLK